jgi:hypothetical protein
LGGTGKSGEIQENEEKSMENMKCSIGRHRQIRERCRKMEARRGEVSIGDPGDLQSNLGKIQGDTKIGRKIQ